MNVMLDSPCGALAQLVERNNGIVEVNGSIPLRSRFSHIRPLA